MSIYLQNHENVATLEVIKKSIPTKVTSFYHNIVNNDLGIIVDLSTNFDSDMTSVTNVADEVVRAFSAMYDGLPSKLAYRDSELAWAMLNHDGTKFTGFSTITPGKDYKGLSVDDFSAIMQSQVH
ncbi:MULTISPECIES: hypothetical protein [Vibrio]|uniref:Uncharacterized protein n=1 Tax=Vibrio tasmaniensis TaxID=212663 RepID=A0A2N7NNI4_9VIBR|nr:hypothetical protein [Vibrio tasmaniensis]PMO80310.1 hypothetical protein BCT01_08445 [Vibrio tasmaniensis]PMP17822.1 hypothetical protein BCS92_05285 [Vibrio tasmaniensis]TKG29027.1 hypothetical protein FC057_20285 [Vibrio tasmaniensis]TKG41574.1 hypothetical protein FC063_06865 [Vibrio tasmaniensis]TKG46223.1 hypothetical protein FC070_22330 [Vibrio tasmaniensis]